jgi:solute:Na+ symporter, SSS family
MSGVNVIATSIFVGFFVLVTALGFWASRWKAGDLNTIQEWGMGGRRFGPWVTWFLLGGDIYTAYTIIAVPAAVYALGAYGFFSVPLTVMVYPLMYLLMPRLWNVSNRHGYITIADFAYGRFGNRGLEVAVALTSILAVMPFIALQLVGMEKVIQALGLTGEGWMTHLPLVAAFLILAIYTYTAGLRAPAVIAFVKDAMVYIFVIVAITYIPYKLGGYGEIFGKAGAALDAKAVANAALNPVGNVNLGLTLKPAQIIPFFTTIITSCLCLFLFPHAYTGIMSASGPKTIRFNTMLLPAYTLLLGLIALIGVMGLAAGVAVKNAQDIVPTLFLKLFPDWFVGFAFSAVVIGALVPAAVMSIGAANTFTRNLWRPLVNPDLAGAQEASLAKFISLLVKLGALAMIILLNTQFAIDYYTLAGVVMVQVVPLVYFGLYTRRIHGTPLLIGWAAGLSLGIYLCYTPTGWVPTWATPFGFRVYIGLVALLVNLFVSVGLSFILPNLGADQTQSSDYEDAVAAQ